MSCKDTTRKLQANIPDEYNANSQNTNKPNLTAYYLYYIPNSTAHNCNSTLYLNQLGCISEMQG